MGCGNSSALPMEQIHMPPSVNHLCQETRPEFGKIDSIAPSCSSKSLIDHYQDAHTLSSSIEARKNVAKDGKQFMYMKGVEVHQLFNSWLGWSPEPSSPCFQAMNSNFPGALPASLILSRVQQTLMPMGFNCENTIYGQSICPDEINFEKGGLADQLKNYFGEVFPLGGIGAVPFVGKTGFGAFSAHCPDDGHVFILYGPHIAISEAGEVGKFLRRRQNQHSTACGALIAAYNQLCFQQSDGDESFDPMDMQQSWLREHLGPVASKIGDAPNPLAALAIYSFEMVHAELMSILNHNFGGKIILLGGVQLNMPYGCEEHFCPFNFQIISGKQEPPVDLLDAAFELGAMAETVTNTLQTALNTDDWAELRRSRIASRGSKYIHPLNHYFSWLGWSPKPLTACERALFTNFPGAMPSTSVVSVLKRRFVRSGLTPANTIYGTSICSDEINNAMGTLSDKLRSLFTQVFPLGGIGGAPFVGKTGFKAFSAHVPDDGNVFILYGPHVGVSLEGEIGKCRRVGQSKDSTACGALIAAYNQCCDGYQADSTSFDMQQDWLRGQVAPHAGTVQSSAVPLAQLAIQGFDIVHKKLQAIVDTEFGSGYLVLLGGVQINTPDGMEDHFLPMHFTIRAKGKATEDLIDEFCFKDIATQMQHLTTDRDELSSVTSSTACPSGDTGSRQETVTCAGNGFMEVMQEEDVFEI